MIAPTEAPRPIAPGLFEEPMTPRQILFSLDGRIPRKTFWLYGVLAPLLVAVLVIMLLGIAGVPDRIAEGVANLLILWPAIAVAVKRWHDRNKSGWWILINFVPVIGVIWSLVENGLLRGSIGDNRFGADLTGKL